MTSKTVSQYKSTVKSGHFSLFGLLEFASSHPKYLGVGGRRQREYSKKVNDLLEGIPKGSRGWYFWGRFNDTGWWETVYLGKAGGRKFGSLRGRLSEEFRDELIAFWASVYGREVASRQFHKRHNGRYDPTRSLRKMGAQFVIWIAADVPEDKIKRQEEALIRIYRPTHNAQRGGPMRADKLTEEIECQLERELKEITGSAHKSAAEHHSSRN
jgi:hypothetical protein